MIYPSHICVLQVNGADFRGITHQQAVTVLKRCGSTADIVCQYLPEGMHYAGLE